MACYRKIDTRMRCDSRFRELSSPGPSWKYLWTFLLPGPQTSSLYWSELKGRPTDVGNTLSLFPESIEQEMEPGR